MNPVPRWRIVLAILILAALAFLLAEFAPFYFHNMALQSYVSEITRSVENQAKKDDALRAAVVDKARQLNLPVVADNVHINRAPEGMHIDVRYAVEVNLPGYTVRLHFYPGAGSR